MGNTGGPPGPTQQRPVGPRGAKNRLPHPKLWCRSNFKLIKSRDSPLSKRICKVYCLITHFCSIFLECNSNFQSRNSQIFLEPSSSLFLFPCDILLNQQGYYGGGVKLSRKRRGWCCQKRMSLGCVLNTHFTYIYSTCLTCYCCRCICSIFAMPCRLL